MGDFVSQTVRNGIIVFKFCIRESFFKSGLFFTSAFFELLSGVILDGVG